MLLSVVLYITGSNVGVAACVQPSSMILAAVTQAQATLPADGVAAGVPNLAENPGAAMGFPGLIVAVVAGCLLIFYLAHRRKP
jgi:hypothetical protein